MLRALERNIDEHALDGDRAIELALEWSKRHDFRLVSKTLDTLGRVGGVTTESRLIDAWGNVLGIASGKGVGQRGVASGLFEAIEHAAIDGTLPAQDTRRLFQRCPIMRAFVRSMLPSGLPISWLTVLPRMSYSFAR